MKIWLLNRVIYPNGNPAHNAIQANIARSNGKQRSINKIIPKITPTAKNNKKYFV